jgi:hypothetical protein
MSASAPEPQTPPGQRLAILAESLYLANLLVAPGLAFGVLLYLYGKHASSAPPLARCHLRQTLSASLWAGALLILVNLLILLLGGYRTAYTWLLVILYFVVCHTSLVLLGMFGLAKAMAGQCYRYPLVGRPL